MVGPFGSCIAALALAWATNAAADTATTPVRRVLHVCDCPAAVAAEERADLLTAFRKLGYVQGRNLDLATHDFAAGRDSYAAFLAREVARTNPALVLASGVRVAEAAKDMQAPTPVVFWRLTDPVGRGLVASLAHPQGRLTGFSRGIEKLTVKRLELLHEMLPQARRVAFAFIADYEPHRRQAAEVRAAAPALELQIQDYALPASEWVPDRLDALFARMRQDRVDALLLPDTNVLPTTLVELAGKYRLPTIHSLTHTVTEWGGLAAYATLALDDLDGIAGYADRILRGARPQDLPVQEPARFELVLNERAARELGLSFPPVFRLRATQVLSK